MDWRWVIVLAAGLILAAFVHGGVYQIVGTPVYVYRLNKFTGQITFCVATECDTSR